MKIRVTKEAVFEMSHALWNYDGLCRNIHGHSYKVVVTVSGTPVNNANDPKNGMVIDFGDLKKIIKEEITDVFDHSLVIYEKAGKEWIDQLPKITGRLVFTPYQPTSEMMVADFADKIMKRLPAGTELVSVKLYETATSSSEWLAADQKT
ncbi:MAG: 6-carboxytetrahydropterin synthase QueD [Bacteroidetes bacterium GWF2_38_335]|nr:MAG: 6-carboxytetrahydropterin synthase QueD [Bacteroidetes bacterium GWF2_38_335]OFY79390.1 MAG: 6-carboxytetrahydropterin synthase QueD [Bacteroidetes bacterium RIFOXYA12_FULL_38_20]HBS85654.1 6-carboxytetrahydropterin synthase QueD [Bacteroidales bacterium]